MAKRYNTRTIKKHHCYSIEEAGEAVGVHPQTVRAWIEKGLPCLKQGMPYLILGEHLQAFLSAQVGERKKRLAPNELYCLRCKSSKSPAGGMADFIPEGVGRGRLTGICPDCESLCHRFAREDRLHVVAPDLAVIRPAAEMDLEEPEKAA